MRIYYKKRKRIEQETLKKMIIRRGVDGWAADHQPMIMIARHNRYVDRYKVFFSRKAHTGGTLLLLLLAFLLSLFVLGDVDAVACHDGIVFNLVAKP